MFKRFRHRLRDIENCTQRTPHQRRLENSSDGISNNLKYKPALQAAHLSHFFRGNLGRTKVASLTPLDDNPGSP